MSDQGSRPNGAGGADDLRSIIASAIAEDEQRQGEPAGGQSGNAGSAGDQAGAPAGGGGDSVAGAGAAATGGGAAAADSVAGAAGGGAAAADSVAGAAGGAADTGGAAAAAGAQPGEAAPRATGPGDPPEHWSEEDKTTFNALPSEAKAPFMTFYKRMESSFTPKLQRGAALERDYGPIDERVFNAETRRYLEQRGTTIPQVIWAWAQVEAALLSNNPQDPDLKNRVMANLIHNYGGNTDVIADALISLREAARRAGGGQGGGAATGGRANGGGAPPTPNGANGHAPINPELERRMTALESESRERGRGQAKVQIDAFVRETNPDGSLKHPFFQELESDMTELAAYELDHGRRPSLQELYDTAVSRNPAFRDKLLQSEREAAARRAADEARERSERARRAASSVTGSPDGGPSQAIAPADDDLEISQLIRKNMNAGNPGTSGGRGRI